MQFIKKLQDQTPIVPGGDTGGNLKLADVPAAVGGRINYIDAIVFSIAVTLGFVATGAAATAVTLKPQGLVQQILIDIPTVGILVQLSGDEITRLYRLRHRGDYPPSQAAVGTGALAGVTPVTAGTIFDGVRFENGLVMAGDPGTAVLKFDLPIEFADPEARDADDFAIPAALLAGASCKVTWNGILASGQFCVSSFTNLDPQPTVNASLLTTTVLSRARAALLIPKLTTQEAVNIVGTQPNLDPIAASVSHEGLAPQAANGVFTSGDYGQTGVSWGGSAYMIAEDTLPTGRLYSAFNLASRTDMQDHTVVQTERTSVIPFVWPPDTRRGQSLVSEVVPAGLKPRLRADVSAGAYKIIRRTVWAPGPWMSKVRSLLGIVAGSRARVKTSNGNKGTSYAADLPLEVL